MAELNENRQTIQPAEECLSVGLMFTSLTSLALPTLFTGKRHCVQNEK